MSDQERYIQILERENAYLRIKLILVRGLLSEAFGLSDPVFNITDPEDKAAVQHRLEEVLSDAE